MFHEPPCGAVGNALEKLEHRHITFYIEITQITSASSSSLQPGVCLTYFLPPGSTQLSLQHHYQQRLQNFEQLQQRHSSFAKIGVGGGVDMLNNVRKTTIFKQSFSCSFNTTKPHRVLPKCQNIRKPKTFQKPTFENVI